MKVRVLWVVTAGFLAAPHLWAVPDRPVKKKDPVKEEARKLEGTWECTGMEYNGRQYPAAILVKIGNPKLVIKGNKLTSTSNRQNETTTIALKIDPKKKPKTIDLVGPYTGPNGTAQAVYILEGDTLKTCHHRNGQPRPARFTAEAGSNHFVFTWKRAKK